MTKQQLYFTLFQISASPDCVASLEGLEDYNRELAVTIGKNNQGRISTVSMEFCGPRSRFHCLMLPEGNTQYGFALNSFSMPRTKLTSQQRGFALLACLDFLNANGIIEVSLPYYFDKISYEVCKGNPAFKRKFLQILQNSKDFADKVGDLEPVDSDFRFSSPEFFAF